jgi:hypothetical protein
VNSEIEEMKKKLAQLRFDSCGQIEEQNRKNWVLRNACAILEQGIWESKNSGLECKSFYIFSGMMDGSLRQWKVDTYFMPENPADPVIFSH